MNSLEKDVFHLEILKNQNIFQDVLVKKTNYRSMFVSHPIKPYLVFSNFVGLTAKDVIQSELETFCKWKIFTGKNNLRILEKHARK